MAQEDSTPIKNEKLLCLNLQFFASADAEGRTEKPTPKRRDDARKEGQVAKSPEITTAFSLFLLFWSMKVFGAGVSLHMQELFYYSLNLIQDMQTQFTIIRMTGLVIYLMSKIAVTVAPIFCMAFFVGLVTNFVQVGWHPTTKPLKPKFKKLNPVQGMKKIFSLRSLLEIPKSFAKIGLILFILYLELRNEYENILILIDMSLTESLSYIANLCIMIGMKVGAWYLLIAAADYAFNKRKHEQDLKMTKQQVKEEFKNQEGDPQIKSKIKSKMREVSMRRMLQEVQGADVVITNPTHYAVAIKYDKMKAAAPIVIAKGVDFMAQKIKKTAKEHGVHIVENKHLARMLYSSVDIDQEIPEELYQSVAEILAYVYSIKKPA